MRDAAVPTSITAAVWSDVKPDGNVFFLFFFLWVHSIPLMTTARSTQGKVFYEIVPPYFDCTLYTKLNTLKLL